MPAFDPTAADNPPPPPGSTSLVKVDAPADAKECRTRLKELAKEMLSASPTRLKALGLEIQRLRLAEKLFTEAEEGTSDPDTYRELSMLNRMLAGEDDLEDPTGDEARLAEAEAVLAGRGIDPARARRLIRTLENLNATPEPEPHESGRRTPPR